MLIQNLSLKNFKCFEEVDVEFAPITLLTGANSSGKSSLIYSLLAVLQTEQFPFYLSPHGKYVNLGGFEEMVKDFDSQGTMEISIKGNPKTHQFALVLNTSLESLKNQEYSFITQWDKDVLGAKPSLKSCNIQLKNYSFILNSQKRLNLNIDVQIFPGLPFKNQLETLFNTKEVEVIKKDNAFFETETLKVNNGEIPKNDTSSILLKEILFQKPKYVKATIDTNFNYIGSFRQPPERTYYQKAKAQSKVDTDGAGYIDQIIEWEETDPEKLAELAKIMSELELFKEIKSNKFKGGRFELAVKTQANSELAALTDVGFGISQFLPIIVADLQLDDNSCLALSQPEIHLHPKIQALFGNFLANQIKRTQKQYIVETHSEYLLNRIRLLLVKGELKPEDVRVYYFENDGIKTTTHKVEFATDGQIKGAPQGFFDTYAIDVLDIAMNSFAD